MRGKGGPHRPHLEASDLVGQRAPFRRVSRAVNPVVEEGRRGERFELCQRHEPEPEAAVEARSGGFRDVAAGSGASVSAIRRRPGQLVGRGHTSGSG